MGVAASGCEKALRIDGKMTMKNYLEILKQNLKTSARKVKPRQYYDTQNMMQLKRQQS